MDKTIFICPFIDEYGEYGPACCTEIILSEPDDVINKQKVEALLSSDGPRHVVMTSHPVISKKAAVSLSGFL